LERGPDFLLCALPDLLVDSYSPLPDKLDERLEAREDRIIGGSDRAILPILLGMKRDLTRPPKHAGPLREVVQVLTTRDFPGIRPETIPLMRSLADHSLAKPRSGPGVGRLQNK
jgi:Mg2+ and Co2+ transporter CorA